MTAVIGIAPAGIFSALAPVVGVMPFVPLTVLLDAIIPGVISSVEQTAKTEINKGVTQGFGTSLPAVMHTTLPGTSAPNWDVNTEELVVSPEKFGYYARMTLAPLPAQQPVLKLNGSPSWDPAYDASPQQWAFEVTMPAGLVQVSDPTVRVAWSITGANIDPNAFSSDARLVTPDALKKTISFDPNAAAYADVNGWSNRRANLSLTRNEDGRDLDDRDPHVPPRCSRYHAFLRAVGPKAGLHPGASRAECTHYKLVLANT